MLASPDEVAEVRPIAEAIEVESGATCLGPDPIRQRVADHLGVPALDARVHVRVVGDPVDPFAAGFVVTTRDGLEAERRFTAAPRACEEFVSVVAVAIVLAVDDLLVDEDSPPASAPPPARGPSAPLRLAIEPAPRVEGALSVLGQGAFAVLPGAAGGATMRAEIGGRIGRGRLALGVLHAPSIAVADGEAKATLLTARLDACAGGHAARARTWWGGCAGVVAGPLFASGRDFTISTDDTVAYAAAVFGLSTEVAVSRPIALLFELDGWVPFVRPRFTAAAQSGRIVAETTVPPIGVVVSLGLRTSSGVLARRPRRIDRRRDGIRMSSH